MSIINQGEIAFIESNTTGTGSIFLEKAIAKGFRPLFITSDPNKYNFLTENLIQAIVLDTHSENEIYDYLKHFKNLRAVFSTSEYYIEIACKIAKAFGLAANDPAAIKLCRNKDILAKTLSTQGIQCPKTFVANSVDQINDFYSELTFDSPVIVKPAKGSGSIGVLFCSTKDEVYKQAKFLFEENNRESNAVLIQEYIEGDEYSVETISFDNQLKIIGITKKYLSKHPYFLETGHDFPVYFSKDITDKIEALIKSSFESVGFLFGPAHTEIRIKNDIPYIIEINPRLAGGMIPEMVKKAIGLDLIEATLDLLTQKKVNLSEKYKQYASIRFIIPKTSGFIKSIQFDHDNIHNNTVDFKINKKVNELIALRGDFRDRIGHIIVQESALSASQQLADDLINSICVETTEETENIEPNQNYGRIQGTLLPEVQAIISQELPMDDRVEELALLTDIDEAHIMMLLETKNITQPQAKQILFQIEKLKKENFNLIKNNVAPRGLYVLYENYLIEKLGINVAGVTHTARSRNDINATLFKLKLRTQFFNIYKKLWKLRSTLINHSKLSFLMPIPIYSQYQTALPGTLAHYLLGIENALSRDQTGLESLYADLEICPLGAGAGGGTSIPIDQNMSAEFLGFKNVASNSLDAVASRDLALRLLSVLCVCSVTLSRLTEDLQLWSTNEFGFIELPDTLCGGSSMMPQKKNPYLLEKIKGILLSLLGDYTASITTMYKVPFGNSVEVGTESVKSLHKACHNFMNAIELLIIIVKHIKLNDSVVKENQLKNLSMATYITDLLVKNKSYSFREAHHLVGENIKYALDNNLNPLERLIDFLKSKMVDIDPDPLKIALETEYGGGPGSKSTCLQYYQGVNRLNEHSNWLKTKQSKIKNAKLKLEKSTNDILSGNGKMLEETVV